GDRGGRPALAREGRAGPDRLPGRRGGCPPLPAGGGLRDWSHPGGRRRTAGAPVTSGPQSPPASQVAGWLVGCLFAGWLVAYNLFRIGGSNPSDAALPALGIGVVAGLAVFAAGYLALRRLAAAGRVVAP